MGAGANSGKSAASPEPDPRVTVERAIANVDPMSLLETLCNETFGAVARRDLAFATSSWQPEAGAGSRPPVSSSNTAMFGIRIAEWLPCIVALMAAIVAQRSAVVVVPPQKARECTSSVTREVDARRIVIAAAVRD